DPAPPDISPLSLHDALPIFSVNGWRPLYENCRQRANEVQPDLEYFLAAELSHLENAWPSKLSLGIIHADLFPDNVFFLGNKLSGDRKSTRLNSCHVAISYAV